ncbi:MAG: ATP-binding protein [Thermoanaerobaculia bacterium]
MSRTAVRIRTLRAKSKSTTASIGDKLALRTSFVPAALLTSDLSFLAVNGGLAQLLGQPAATLSRKSLIDLIDPQQREALDARVAELRSNKTRTLQMELRILDGNERPSRVLLIAHRNGRGVRSPIVGYFVDLREVTHVDDDRTALLDAIERAAWEWRRTFDAVEMPILIVGAASTVSRINRAARMLLGRQYGEIIGRSLRELPPSEPWLSINNLAEDVQQRRAPAAKQVKDSAGRTLDLLAMLFNSDDSRDDRVIVIVWDVSALVDLQSRLEQQRTMATMGALVAGVAHEVRNPLFAISATVDAMEQASKGELREYFEVLREEIDRMTRLMQDLLAYGRPSAAVFAEITAGEIVDQAMRFSAPLATKLRVELRNVVHADPTISADRERLGRAVQNLIDNALQHSPPGAEVEVTCATRTRDRSRYVDIAVADRGRGFSTDDLPRLFEPFFSRRKGGTGLGLALVQQIVTEHGGEVAAANRPGGGAVVTISIPLPSP